MLDCNTERIYDVLKQAQQIGMMSDYHSYLITSLDLHSVDLEEFKYGGTNITALRLVDPEKPELQKVVRNWVYGELRYGRKLDLPPPRVRNLDSVMQPEPLAHTHTPINSTNGSVCFRII